MSLAPSTRLARREAKNAFEAPYDASKLPGNGAVKRTTALHAVHSELLRFCNTAGWPAADGKEVGGHIPPTLGTPHDEPRESTSCLSDGRHDCRLAGSTLQMARNLGIAKHG